MTKTAIVTGGAGGLGKAIARALREKDWNLALVDVAVLIHMTKQFALELAPRGVTCNAIASGPVEGDMARVHPPDQVADYLKTIPQARYANAKDIADAVVFLCAPDAAHITGQCIAVDGGWTAAGVGVAAAQRHT